MLVIVCAMLQLQCLVPMYFSPHLRVKDYLSWKQNLLPRSKPEINSEQSARVILNVKLNYPIIELRLKDDYLRN